MRIGELEVVPVAHREPPLRNAWGVHPETQARTIVRIRTEDGLEGVGETYGSEDVIEELREAESDLVGESPYDREPLREAFSEQAFGAIETALLDLIGKSVGEPVHRLLGGNCRDEVEFSAYLFYKLADSNPEAAAICPGEVLSPEAMVEEAREFHETHGFDVLKLKAGILEPDVELRTLELFGEAFGPDQPLRIDTNGSWSVETTLSADRRLAETDLNVQFLEDPVMHHEDRVAVRDELEHPFATNHVHSTEELAREVRADSIDVILSDHHYFGGLSGNALVNGIARTFDLGVGMHSNSHLGISMAAMVHSAAAMPGLTHACDTHYPWEADDVIRSPFEFEDGCLSVPDEPGLGVEIDEAELDRLNDAYGDAELIGSTEAMRRRDPDFEPNTENQW